MKFTLSQYLASIREGQWFGFSKDIDNPNYENLIIYSDDPKPTKKECEDGVATMQAEYDALDYSRKRKAEYGALNQFEMQFDDKEDGTTTWEDAIKTIKTKWPKDNSGPVE